MKNITATKKLLEYASIQKVLLVEAERGTSWPESEDGVLLVSQYADLPKNASRMR